MADRRPKTAREITTAICSTRELPFVLALSNAERNAIGFFPAGAIRWYVEQRLCTVAFLRGEPAGFIFGRASLRYARWCRPITALAVARDARRRGLAKLLVVTTAFTAVNNGQEALQAWTRDDLLPATTMWQRFSFSRICQRQPATADRKTLTLWRAPTMQHLHHDFYEPPPVAGWRAARVGNTLIS